MDPALLWLWDRPVAMAPITLGISICHESGPRKGKKTKKKKKKERKKRKKKNPTSIHKDSGWIPGPDHWVKDLALLWLWRRPAAAALI